LKPFNENTYRLLARPFPVESLKFRVGPKYGNNAKPLTYIDARDAYERLDEVLGPDGWSNEYQLQDKRITCSIIVKDDNGNDIVKSNGAGDTDFEADKGAYSDAFKRAAVLLGVGRYLYNTDLGWHPFESKGNSAVFSDRTIHELREKMRTANEEVPFDNVVSITKVSGSEGQSRDKQVAANGTTLTKSKARARELVRQIDLATSEEELLEVVAENYDMLATLYDHDRSKNPNIKWYISNGDHEFKSLKDRLVERAFVFGPDSVEKLLTTLDEHVEYV